MRGFWLKDENGTVESLNGKPSGVWLTNPTGLGIDTDDNFVRCGASFFLPPDGTQDPQGVLQCDLVITPNFQYTNAYTQYTRFVDWLLSASELRLYYSPDGTLANAYYRRVRIPTLSKGDVKGGGLTCPTTIYALEPWRKDIQVQNMTLIDGEYVFDTTGFGHIAFPFRLEASCGLLNPSVSMTDADGTQIGRCKLNYSISQGDVFILDTRPDSAGVYKRDGSTGKETSLLQYLYLDADPFPQIPVYGGTITLSSDETISASGAQVAIYPMWRTV